MGIWNIKYSGYLSAFCFLRNISVCKNCAFRTELINYSRQGELCYCRHEESVLLRSGSMCCVSLTGLAQEGRGLHFESFSWLLKSAKSRDGTEKRRPREALAWRLFPRFSPITSLPNQVQLQAMMESHIETAWFSHYSQSSVSACVKKEKAHFQFLWRWRWLLNWVEKLCHCHKGYNVCSLLVLRKFERSPQLGLWDFLKH